MNAINFDEALRELVQFLHKESGEGLKRMKLKILEDHSLLHKVTSEGKEVSWKLRVVSRILGMNQKEYSDGKWQRLVLGEIDSLGTENDQRARRIVQELCRRRLQQEERSLQVLAQLPFTQQHSMIEQSLLESFSFILRERIQEISQLYQLE